MSYITHLRKQIGHAPIIMVGACTIIINEQEQLLFQLRKDNDCWGLAGGAMELGESLTQTAAREMYEETGLTPHHLKLLHVFSGQDYYYQYPNGDEVYNVIAAYLCNKYSGDLQFDKTEATNLRFFDMHQLPTNISPPDALILSFFLHKLKEQQT